MAYKHCLACGESFKARAQVPQQTYCSAPDCQRARRLQWQRKKLKSDPDYLENQARAQQAWAERNPDYWRTYRATSPKYTERNRALQRDRNAKSAATAIVKMDASKTEFPFYSGVYQLRVIERNEIAKMDVWIVEITAYSCDSEPDN